MGNWKSFASDYQMGLFEATRCPYWPAGLSLTSREWARGLIPGQNRLGNILAKVRNELCPYYQDITMTTSDQHASPAEALALSAQLPLKSPRKEISSSTAGNMPPLLPPHNINQMLSQPPPSFTTANRVQPLTEEASDSDTLSRPKAIFKRLLEI